MALVGRWLAIQSYKHDGTIHRFWDRGLVVEDNEDYLVLVSKKAKVIENNGRKWFTREPAVTIFSKKRWWNAICMLKNDGVCYYCNIASPSIISSSYIKYIDYDLDVKLYPNKDVRILDEKEFLAHSALYGYGDELMAILRYEKDYVLKKIKNNEFPFSDDLIHDYYSIFLERLKDE